MDAISQPMTHAPLNLAALDEFAKTMKRKRLGELPELIDRQAKVLEFIRGLSATQPMGLPSQRAGMPSLARMADMLEVHLGKGSWNATNAEGWKAADNLVKQIASLGTEAGNTVTPDTLGEAMRKERGSLSEFPHIVSLADEAGNWQGKMRLRTDFRERLIDAYKADRKQIRKNEETGVYAAGQSPLASTNETLDIVYRARWSKLAEKVRERIDNPNHLAVDETPAVNTNAVHARAKGGRQ